MSEVISGVVEKVSVSYSPKESPRKWTKRAFLINGEWYGTFITVENKSMMEAPGEGDAVKITYDVKGNFKNLVSIEVIAKHEEESGKQYSGGVVAVGGLMPYSAQDKDYRITYLASRRDAIEFVKSALQLNYITLPTKKADQLDAFYKYVNEYAGKFAEDAYLPREQNAVPVVVSTQGAVNVE